MRKLCLTTAIVGVFAVLSMTNAPPAAAQVTFSFDEGNVAFAYNDGWWDRDHHWHRWHNAREAREYRERHREMYHEWRHDRDRDLGWREEERHDRD